MLFTLYSKPEAEAALGERQTDPPLSLHALVESRHEGIRFDWPKMDAAVAALKHELPESWAFPSSGVEQMLRQAVVDLTRALFAADPQSLHAAGLAVREHRQSLVLLGELIDRRLELVDQVRESQWNRDNEFGWLARLAGKTVPP